MYNLSNKNKKILIIFLILFISISSLSLVKTDYYFMSPGPPYQWDIEYENIDKVCEEVIFEHELEGIQEAEYQGKKVKLNDPIRGGSKKFYVYVKNEKGNVIKVSFGDTTGLSIKRDDPARRKSFRARHNCDNPGPKTKARYWSCYQWRAGAKVDN